MPTLGRAVVPGPISTHGFGTIRPVAIDFGGDSSGVVEHITWSTWSGTEALGTGMAEYVGPHQSIAEGSQLTATVVAFKLGTCGAGPAYTAVEWYFPSKDEFFNPAKYFNACTRAYVGPY